MFFIVENFQRLTFFLMKSIFIRMAKLYEKKLHIHLFIFVIFAAIFQNLSQANDNLSTSLQGRASPSHFLELDEFQEIETNDFPFTTYFWDSGPAYNLKNIHVSITKVFNYNYFVKRHSWYKSFSLRGPPALN